MNKKLLIIVLSVVIIVVVLALWFFFRQSGEVASETPGPEVTLPGGKNSGDTTQSQPNSTDPDDQTIPSDRLVTTISVPAYKGGTITVTDFIKDGVTLPDKSNKGRYLLAGDLGYCVIQPKECLAGSAVDFNIFYDSAYGSFTIALLNEPLGELRKSAEQTMQSRLGISQAEMCRLNYYIGTTEDVSALFSGKNLGFSFCPNATTLPQ